MTCNRIVCFGVNTPTRTMSGRFWLVQTSVAFCQHSSSQHLQESLSLATEQQGAHHGSLQNGYKVIAVKGCWHLIQARAHCSISNGLSRREFLGYSYYYTNCLLFSHPSQAMHQLHFMIAPFRKTLHWQPNSKARITVHCKIATK